jgi:hypothetical protein
MNNLGDFEEFDSTAEHEGGAVPRRSIMMGAAWSIPVIALAVATPMAAASEPAFVCPVVPDTSQWTGPVVTSGSFTNGVHEWNAGFWTNTSDAAPGASLNYYLEFPYQQVAGHTYTFAASLRGSGVGPGAAVLGASAGGMTGYFGSTAGGTPNTIPIDNNFNPIAWSYTATTTSLTTFRYSLGFGDVFAGEQNYDLTVTIPQITCS